MWFFSFRKTPNSKPARCSSNSIRPSLEALEDRCLLSAGALDPTFGNGAGYVTKSLTNSNDYGASVVMEPNGTLIESGLTATTGGTAKHPTTSYAAGLTAYNPDGSLDTAFGNGGVAIGPAAPAGGDLNALLYPSTDPNGNGGKFLVTGLNGFAIARYNANGTLDTSFGQGGIATANFGRTLGTYCTVAVVIQPDGKIVALGQSASANGGTAELARFNANGTLDTTFGSNGLVTVAVPDAISLLQQPDGTLVVLGNATLSGYSWGFAMADLNGNGSLNTSFGNGGIVTNSSFGGGVGPTQNSGTLGAIDPTGKTTDDQIVVIGTNPSGGWELARYNPDGTLDSSFGNGGLVNTPQIKSYSVAVVVQPDGKIVASGVDSYSAIGVARYNPDGSLDSTFGTGGIVTTQIGTRFRLFGNAGGMSLQPNGDILVAGSSYNGSKWNFALARYLSSEPQIGSFTANPNPVTAGTSVTLTASNITDGNPGVSITQVTFYLDSNNDGKLETGSDTLLGYATQTSPGVWTLTNASAFGLTAGTYKLFAQAEDSDGVFGDPIPLTLTVQ
jgi:uncharacterized delta-60 repeat protein